MSNALTVPADTAAPDDAHPLTYDWEQTKNDVHASNTAQGVFKHLRALEANRSWVLKRWIWELLQNARDVSDGEASLVISVEVSDQSLTFRHNGRGFEPAEITHLIYYGSTKQEDPHNLGQFGSGFITTHLLSLTIEVSGKLTDGHAFDFLLDRRGASAPELEQRLDASFESFQSSLKLNAVPDHQLSTTFRYPIDARASDAIDQGALALALCGPYVAAFNPEFRSIQFLRGDSAAAIQLKNRRLLAEHVEEVEVEVSGGDVVSPDSRSYVVAELDRVAVAVPFARQDDRVTLISATGMSKLMLGFPLIGTEDFSFPAVVNSLRFSPTEERDGVYLGRNNDQVNLENQSVLEQSCRLLLSIIEFAAEARWFGTYVLAHLPPIHAQNWLDESWLRNCLRTHLIEPLRVTPSVLTESGTVIAPADCALLTAESPGALDQLWAIACHLTSIRELLPRRADAPGWCRAANSWALLSESSLGELDETKVGRDIAQLAAEAATVEALQAQLEDADAVIWLGELHRFLADQAFEKPLRDLPIFPDQSGLFHRHTELRRDQGIPEELKDIAELVDWEIRTELRDTRFAALADEAGAGDVDSDFVVRKLIDLVRNVLEDDPDDDSKAASTRLFTWIVEQEQWHHLDRFPAFSTGGASSVPIGLLQHEDKANERHLAPVTTWPEPLRHYADLFPQRHILADDFAASLDNPNVWSALDAQGFVRSSVLYTHTQTVSFREFLPDEPLPEDEEGETEHKAHETVEVTNVAFLITRDIGVLPRVRQSRRLGQQFWDFVTQWLVVEDASGLHAEDLQCVCGETHRYYPALWLTRVAGNKWVRLDGGNNDKANAHSLAQLVRDTEWPIDLLRTSRGVIALLKALGVGVPDLLMELVTANPVERSTLDQMIAELLTSVGSDWDQLRMLAEDIHNDEGLFDHLEERRELRRAVRENQRLGALVECLVKESLEGEDFHVSRTGKGSDYAIEPRPSAEDDSIHLELVRGDHSWLVEIKSTRGNSVRMTSVQARTAVKHRGSFLLCVVPLGPEPEDPEIETVRECMRFVDGIGARLTDICKKLDDFEDMRDAVSVEHAAGLRLELDSGSPRVCVDSTVWDAGFGLEHLFGRLTATDDV
ncbi:MAG: hypothetical protein OXI79_10735 [Gammaproteobacteria bacterium]|nr:hypothetical protein [Gammaproteobacteria bacterium]